MSEIPVWLVDSFTDAPLTGNAACVVLDADDIDEETCARISAEIGVSEAAFVSKAESEGAEFRLRFFTPIKEVDLCGHATIAAFWVLAEEGRIPLEDGPNRMVQETNLGDLPVWIDAADGKPVRVMMGNKLPQFETPEVNLDKLAALFGMGRKRLNEDHPVEIVNTGLRSLHIPLTGLASFPEVKPLRRGLLDLSKNLDVCSIQIFALETVDPDADIHCRVFAPALGIDEDPVTGTAAGALGAYLVRHGLHPEAKDGLIRIVVEQGREIGRPGLVEVEIEQDEGEFVRIRSGGKAVVSLRGMLRLPR